MMKLTAVNPKMPDIRQAKDFLSGNIPKAGKINRHTRDLWFGQYLNYPSIKFNYVGHIIKEKYSKLFRSVAPTRRDG